MARDLAMSHWSRPRAVRTVMAILQLGGAASTREIREITRSEAVHTDVDHVRCLAQAAGVCDAEEAIIRTYGGTTAQGAHVHVYRLSEPLMARLRAGWLADEMDAERERQEHPPADDRIEMGRRASEARRRAMSGSDGRAAPPARRLDEVVQSLLIAGAGKVPRQP